MKAAIIRQHGGLDAVSIEELPTPRPGPDEVLVRVRACALNHMDLWARKGVPGFKFPLPLIPGCDIAGEVVEGPEVEAGTPVVIQPGFSCGRCERCLQGEDFLCGSYGIFGENRDGGCGEYIVVPRQNLLPKPERLSWAEAAAYPLTFLTAWHMLVTRAMIRPGELVLVHAGGSGIGSAAIQIACLFGARVFATAGTAAKCERARELGAELTINYRDNPDWSRHVYQLTNKRGLDVVIEHVGAATFEGSMRALRAGGRLVTCGATTGGQVELNLQRLFFKNLALLGSTMGSKGELCTVTEHMQSGRLHPIVDRVLPLAEVREAHRILEAREAFGKVVLTP